MNTKRTDVLELVKEDDELGSHSDSDSSYEEKKYASMNK